MLGASVDGLSALRDFSELSNHVGDLSTRRPVLALELNSPLETALRALDMNELRWEVLYHETIGIEEAVEELRPKLSPDSVPVAERMFRNVFDGRPSSETATEKLSGLTQRADTPQFSDLPMLREPPQAPRRQSPSSRDRA